MALSYKFLFSRPIDYLVLTLCGQIFAVKPTGGEFITSVSSAGGKFTSAIGKFSAVVHETGDQQLTYCGGDGGCNKSGK